MMIDSAWSLQAQVPNGAAADRFLATSRLQAEQIDPNDFLYSLKSSFTYDPQPLLGTITAKLFALNFTDDEFNPDELHVLQTLVPKLRHGRYVVQAGTHSSPGHFTMTQPQLWAQHVAAFLRWVEEPDKIVASDNLGSHHTSNVEQSR